MGILIEISPGELVDKLSILEIKLERIGDDSKRRNVAREFGILTRALEEAVEESPQLAALRAELKAINESLWEIEDAIRDCERAGEFGPDFVRLARAVYRTNDRRAEIKRRINDLLDSDIVEEKSYAPYGPSGPGA